MIRNFRKAVYASGLFFILSFAGINIGISFGAEGRNPFKDWFPVIKVEQLVEPEEVKPKKVFNVSKYSLQGVVWGAYQPKAVINNKIYGVGDILDEAEIIKIDKEGVALRLEDEEYLIATKNITIVKKADDKKIIEDSENKESKADR